MIRREVSVAVSVACAANYVGLLVAGVALILLHPQMLWGQATDKKVVGQTAVSGGTVRTDLFISGVYPHLTTYGIYSQNGGHFKPGHNECGIGAIVPWAGKLWMVNYAPHMPKGSEHKLYSVAADLSQPLTIHPESVGGTPAGRMIHAESNQLFIAHYAIDASGKVRAIQPQEMPIRVTAIARHLSDPANMVYYIDMEGSIWEANVHTLAVKRLFKKPVPGWHAKGGYTSQGRLVISNNGELHVGNYDDVLVGGAAQNEEERGVLAEWDGKYWKIVERRQYTEVTGPLGITGGSDGNEPLWAVGWDRRSLRLKLLENGQWHTYLLPKASYCNDASHGWYTEWPRIREITSGRWMMDMHGMFFDFPRDFSTQKSAGLRPIGSHLRYIPDFCDWNGRLVLATDETSIQGNDLAGQPQSNLWFGDYEDIKTWGPAIGYGGPWIEDPVKAGVLSDPFLVAGFEHRTLYLAVGNISHLKEKTLRTTDQIEIRGLPAALAGSPRVSVKRGDWRLPAPGYSFDVNQPVKVYLAVDQRGKPKLPAPWKRTNETLRWAREGASNEQVDSIYEDHFPPGTISIPANAVEHTPGSFGMPHLAFISAANTENLAINPSKTATLVGAGNRSLPLDNQALKEAGKPVKFQLSIDKAGTGNWDEFQSIEVGQGESKIVRLATNLAATWIRFSVDQDCLATAFLHQTTPNHHGGFLSIDELAQQRNASDEDMFAGLADVRDQHALGARIYAAKRNRDLRVITQDRKFFDFTKNAFEFIDAEVDAGLEKLLEVEPEFSVDKASVVIKHGTQVLRLPKGDPGFDRHLLAGQSRSLIPNSLIPNSLIPRAVREVQSERLLANIHGTFYEVPLVTNGAPPAWHHMRPIASHRKQITDFCSWNGLLVLAGVRPETVADEHIFMNGPKTAGLWFGGVDDLWKLGKPQGSGGPWKDAIVQANVPSDPYLMVGYDQKRVQLTHNSTQPIQFALEVDFTGEGHWTLYETFTVGVGETLNHVFPAGFSATWVRAIVDRDTVATVYFDYGVAR